VLFQLKAKACANLGQLDEAQLSCKRSLELEVTDHHTHLLYANVLIEKGELAQAEKTLRKALFLDHTLVEAHYHLGILYLRLGHKSKGIRSLRNALAMTEKRDPERRVANIKRLQPELLKV